MRKCQICLFIFSIFTIFVNEHEPISGTMAFPVDFFAFPLNVLLFLLWAVSVLWLWKSCRKSLLVRFLLSSTATISAVILPLAGCIAIGITGHREWASTWISVAVLLYFQTVLAMVTLRGYRNVRFFLLHAGLLVTIASAFWGAPDSQSARVFISQGETVAAPGYEISVKDINVEKDASGMPALYEVQLTIDDREECLRVNHPIRVGFGRNLYLVSCKESAEGSMPGCVLEEVYEPWRYGATAGIMMILAGAFMMFICGPRRKGQNDD